MSFDGDKECEQLIRQLWQWLSERCVYCGVNEKLCLPGSDGNRHTHVCGGWLRQMLSTLGRDNQLLTPQWEAMRLGFCLIVCQHFSDGRYTGLEWVEKELTIVRRNVESFIMNAANGP